MSLFSCSYWKMGSLGNMLPLQARGPHLLQKALQSPACLGPTPGVAVAPVPGGNPPGAPGWWPCVRSPRHHFHLHPAPRPKPSAAACRILAPGPAQPSVPLSLSWPWGLALFHLGHCIFEIELQLGVQVTGGNSQHQPSCLCPVGAQPMDHVSPQGLPSSIQEFTSWSPRGREPFAV